MIERPALSIADENAVRLLLADFLAVSVAGQSQPSAVAAVRIAHTTPRESEARRAVVIGSGYARSDDAAFANGIIAHGLDMDDTHETSSSHPGAVVFPAALAVAAEQGTTVKDALRAASIGYDVMCALGTKIGAAALYGRGFHPTSVAGVVGAAAAAAVLLDLDEARVAHALGLAADLATGGLEFLGDGSWTKRLNAGNAAAAGVRAAKLAQAGFTAPLTSFEGRNGYFVQFGDGTDASRALTLEPGAGVRSTSVKFYPCCRYMHGAMDLLLAMREREGIREADVSRIEVGVIQAGATLVALDKPRKLDVRTSVDAQFNMYFGAALALAAGRVGVQDFNDARRTAERLSALMAKVDCYASDSIEAAFPERWQAEVRVHLADGRVLARYTEDFRGSPGQPASEADVLEKARSLVAAEAAADVMRAARTPAEEPAAAILLSLASVGGAQ